MRNFLKIAVLTAAMLGGQSAFAQETTTEADDGLDLGVAAGPAVGEPFVLQEFGDWALRCIKAEEGQPDPCNLYQLLVNEGGVAVAEFNVFSLPEGARAAAGATVVVPLETLLTQQLTLTIDDGEARIYPFTFCNRAGCVARLGFSQEQLDQMKRGSAATVRIVPAAAPDEEVVLTVSLTGFTAGIEGTVNR